MIFHTETEPHHKQHWHYLFHRRRMGVGISAKQMATSQVFSLIGSIIAGVLLDINKETLVMIAGTFVILPGVFDLDGSIGAALSAKINHKLNETDQARQVILSSIWFSLRLCVVAGVLVGLVGGLISEIFFDSEFWKIFVIGWGAIMLSGIIGFPLIAIMSYLFKRKNINPDDVVGPIESSVFDILTVINMSIMVGLLI